MSDTATPSRMKSSTLLSPLLTSSFQVILLLLFCTCFGVAYKIETTTSIKIGCTLTSIITLSGLMFLLRKQLQKFAIENTSPKEIEPSFSTLSQNTLHNSSMQPEEEEGEEIELRTNFKHVHVQTDVNNQQLHKITQLIDQCFIYTTPLLILFLISAILALYDALVVIVVILIVLIGVHVLYRPSEITLYCITCILIGMYCISVFYLQFGQYSIYHRAFDTFKFKLEKQRVVLSTNLQQLETIGNLFLENYSQWKSTYYEKMKQQGDTEAIVFQRLQEKVEELQKRIAKIDDWIDLLLQIEK